MTRTHELEQDRAYNDHSRDPDQTGQAPGRNTLTEHLVGANGTLVSGLIRRKARDGNDVELGAEHAVAAASSSSGHTLPASLRSKYESSLGADLSLVRLHTGDESARAAGAVGARAYALGNDIHFGAGHYDPSSSSGEHLLAHEVAHTVQQSSGTIGRKPQFQLDVSSPGDAHELEADRAAAAMTAGSHFVVGSSTAGIARDHDGEPEEFRPKPLLWTSRVQTIPATLEGPPPASPMAALQFDETRAGWHQAGVNGLTAVNAQAFGKLNQLIIAVTEFKASAASAEQASSNFTHDDPSVGLDNVKQEGSDVKIGHAFKDDTVAVDAKKVSTDAMSRDDKLAIAKLKESLGAAKSSVMTTHMAVGDSFNGVTSAIETVHEAANSLRIAKNAQQSAELDHKSNEMEEEHAKVEASIGALKGMVDLAKGLANPEEGMGDLIGGTIDIVESGANLQYDQAIGRIKSQINGLAVQSADLAAENAVIEYNKAVRAVSAAMTSVDAANTAYKTALNERHSKFMDLSALLEKTVIKNGGSPKDASKVQAAVAAVPLVETVLTQLTRIKSIATPPGYTPESGEGAAMCLNLEDFLHLIGTLSGYESAAGAAAGSWKKRLDSVNSLIGSAK